MRKQNYLIRFLALAVGAIAAAEARAGTDVLSLEEAKPYTLNLSLVASVGYSSNAIQLGDGLPLPEGTSRQDYGFFQFGGTFSFSKISADENRQFDLSYDYLQRIYEELEDYDLGVHTLKAVYRHVFDETWSTILELSDEYVAIEEDSFSNKVSFKPKVQYVMNTYLKTHLTGVVATSDNFFPVTNPARNPDANIYSIELTEIIGIKSSKSFELKPSYVHLWNDGTGTDYQFDRDRFQIECSRKASDDPTSPWHKLTLRALYVRDFDRYHELNSRAGPAGFEFKRQDDRDTFNGVLSFDLIKNRKNIQKLALNLSYKYLRQDSNIPRFNYDEHVIILGGSITFQ